MCPDCQSTAIKWLTASGRGRVYSWVVATHPTLEALVDQVPYVVAMIDLDEGVRVIGNVAGIAPDAITDGLAVELYSSLPETMASRSRTSVHDQTLRGEP